MRSFGRQCRGQGRVFVKLVRQTERQLLELGQPIPFAGPASSAAPGGDRDAPRRSTGALTRQLRSALAAQSASDPRQEARPLTRQCLRSDHCSHPQREEQLPGPVWAQTRHVGTRHRLYLCHPGPVMWSPCSIRSNGPSEHWLASAGKSTGAGRSRDQ